MNSDRKYFEGVGKDSYTDFLRQEYKKRNSFSDTFYYKVVDFSVKLYKQAVKVGNDIEGNPLSPEEIAIADTLIKRMAVELELHRESFERDQEEQE
ncbi:hypothetical protein [Bacillus amyloliquefaciens]|uniref:hypothetical protein n=1 Tax=Bacillus amyloliquefaciens TaxID=1390 RepID=UPI0005EE0145|nr:hypothetical protein [Bacillus amyloliquefaciens]